MHEPILLSHFMNAIKNEKEAFTEVTILLQFFELITEYAVVKDTVYTF